MSEILGVLFAAFVGILVIPKFAEYQKASADNTRAAVTAQQHKQFNAAVTAYSQQNAVALQATATSINPVVITVPMLQAIGVDLLPTSFSVTNPYGQTWQAEVLQPAAGTLQVLSTSTGGTALPDTQATKIATMVGAAGGFIPQNDSGLYAGTPATAYGAFAGWTISTANYTGISGGHPAALLTFKNGQLANNYLYRNAVPGQPQLNTMTTPLIMGAVQVINSGCTTTGAIAQDGTGTLLSCQGGTWKAQGSAYWQSPVSTSGSLPACTASSQWTTRIVQTPSGGTGPRAYTCNGASWQPLAVDDLGNLRVDGEISVGANNRILGNGSQGPYGATTMAGQKNGWTGIEYRDASGNYQINQMTNRSNIGYYDAVSGRWLNYTDTSGNLTLDQTADYASGRINPGWAVETWGCTTGQIAKAAYTVADGWAWNGKTLSCVSGVWTNAGASSGPQRSIVPCSGSNTTSKTWILKINVLLNAYVGAGPFNAYLYVNGALVDQVTHNYSGTNVATSFNLFGIVGPGNTYNITGAAPWATCQAWSF